MMYTQEQNREIEKVMNAFADYIRDTRVLICYGQIRWDMYSLTGFLRSRMTFAWRRLFSGMVKRFVRK